jgi:hypothetical protein
MLDDQQSPKTQYCQMVIKFWIPEKMVNFWLAEWLSVSQVIRWLVIFRKLVKSITKYRYRYSVTPFHIHWYYISPNCMHIADGPVQKPIRTALNMKWVYMSSNIFSSNLHFIFPILTVCIDLILCLQRSILENLRNVGGSTHAHSIICRIAYPCIWKVLNLM